MAECSNSVLRLTKLKKSKEGVRSPRSNSNDLVHLIEKLTSMDQTIRNKKFEFLRMKNEAKKLSEIIKGGSGTVSEMDFSSE
jgi:hypothetical protein